MRTLPIHDYFPDASQLVYGCMHLGGGWNSNGVSRADVKQVENIIEICFENDINMFDLADIYTFGKAEEAFGKALNAQPALREKMVMQTKVGIKLTPTHNIKQYDLSPQWIQTALNASLRRLQCEHIDILFLHRPDPLMELEETATAINTLHAQGKFSYLAVSNMHASQIAWLQSALTMPIIANQLQMSLAHADFVEDGITANMKENTKSGFPSGTLEYCQQQNIQLQAWSALALGKFSGNKSAQPDSAEIATTELVKQLAARYSSNVNAVVLAWLMRHPTNIQPVVGTTHIERLKQCAQAPQLTLSRDDWYHLLQTARGNEVP